jgi:hypothetical protein
MKMKNSPKRKTKIIKKIFIGIIRYSIKKEKVYFSKSVYEDLKSLFKQDKEIIQNKSIKKQKLN